MKQPTTRQELEAFAQLLETVKQQRILSAEEFDDLHARFLSEDESGVVWTVGIHTKKWHCRASGKWVAADPPENLYLDEEVAADLRDLIAKQWEAAIPNATSKTPPTLTCAHCGARRPPGKKFCIVCGAPAVSGPAGAVAPATRPCPKCGQPVIAGKKFCTSCGHRF